jgi:dienelactone hydrolase
MRTAVICLLFVSAAYAEAPRVLPPGRLPDDSRLGPLKDLNGYFPFVPCKSKEEWAVRAERLHRQLLVATGLWPMPAATPPRAVVHGLVDRDGYTVEKVLLESFPGHFVTGNLYRPKGGRAPWTHGRLAGGGRLPAVLSPHGHWAEGRFYDAGEAELRKQIAQGAERFDPSGRYPLQARCVQLARMGCIVFHYDMVGYADSVQLDHHAGLRPAMNVREDWGYYSPQAEARLQTVMGLQTYNSIRALDWLSRRDDVDPRRIGVTGASGGGTQTFILAAIDPRPAAAFPAVMVSTAMQGGCTCENASYLRVGTGNVEIAALIAPRPLGMTAADDWTKEIAAKGLPELKAHYRMLGVEDRVTATPLLQFPHNYNYASRAVMYRFFNAHLKLGLPGPIVEADFKPLSVREMSVWDAAHPKPPCGDDYERSLLRSITAHSDRQMTDLLPKDGLSLAKYREVVGGAVDVLIGRGVPAAGAIVVKQRQDADRGSFRLSTLLLRHTAQGEELPAILLEPKSWNKQVVIWIGKEGKQSLLDAQGAPRGAVRRLLAAGMAVLGADLLGQGDFSSDGKPWAKARLNKSGQGTWTAYAGYTFGYNYPLFAQRVHDVLSVVSFARNTLGAARVHLVGLGGAGHWVLAARTQAGAAVDRAAADTAGFRFARLAAIDDPDFLPGGAKYLDLPGIAALSAPLPLWLAGESTATSPVVAAAYKAAAASRNLVRFSGRASQQEAAAVEWLLQ